MLLGAQGGRRVGSPHGAASCVLCSLLGSQAGSSMNGLQTAGSLRGILITRSLQGALGSGGMAM